MYVIEKNCSIIYQKRKGEFLIALYFLNKKEKVSIVVGGAKPLALMFKSQKLSSEKRELTLPSLFGFQCKLVCNGGQASDVSPKTSTSTTTTTSTTTLKPKTKKTKILHGGLHSRSLH